MVDEALPEREFASSDDVLLSVTSGRACFETRFMGIAKPNKHRGGVLLATTQETGARMERTGESIAGRHDETKWALLTTEFWAMLVLIAAILIAAAVSDSFDDVRAWTLVTLVGAAYIVSRGIAKSGTDHDVIRGRRG